jgi:hypothetical protein
LRRLDFRPESVHFSPVFETKNCSESNFWNSGAETFKFGTQTTDSASRATFKARGSMVVKRQLGFSPPPPPATNLLLYRPAGLKPFTIPSSAVEIRLDTLSYFFDTTSFIPISHAYVRFCIQFPHEPAPPLFPQREFSSGATFRTMQCNRFRLPAEFSAVFQHLRGNASTR